MDNFDREWFLRNDVLVSDNRAIKDILSRAELVKPKLAPIPVKLLPAKVDLSPYLRFIRCQGGEGCWGYSLQSVWDIMNELACPYSPNLSMSLGLFLHRRRDLWESKGGINSPDGRFHSSSYAIKWLDISFGAATEGTEPTHPSTRWTGNWTVEGANEADNYRLASDIQKITVSSTEFMNWLAADHPIQLVDDGHLIAVVGYDANKKTFKFVNSYGDRWGTEGYSEYTFSQIDTLSGIWGGIEDAFIVDIVTPRPVPAARIWFKHSYRMNVQLWLSVEDSPLPKRKIWPAFEWADDSKDLHFTVRLPSELIWPPVAGRRLALDLIDTGAFSETGGELVEFSAAFGGDILKCADLAKGSVKFKARQQLRVTIP